MSVEFSLDPETLALRAKPVPTIRFHPDNAEHYALTNGELELHSVTRTEAGNLEISATARGKMVRQTKDGAEHNDAQEFRAKFDLRNVASRGAIPLP